MEKLAIILEGGIVQAVVATGALVGAQVHVIDYDTDGGEQADFAKIVQSDGKEVDAYHSLNTVTQAEIAIPEGAFYPPSVPSGCYVLSIDNDDGCKLHLFTSDAEREAFMWGYAYSNTPTTSVTLEDFKAEYDHDISEAMGETLDGWVTEDVALQPPAPPVDPVRDAAPDLLAALKECQAAIRSLDEQLGQMQAMFDDEDGVIENAIEDGDNAVAMASAAIAKAEGRANG